MCLQIKLEKYIRFFLPSEFSDLTPLVGKREVHPHEYQKGVLCAFTLTQVQVTLISEACNETFTLTCTSTCNLVAIKNLVCYILNVMQKFTPQLPVCL